MKLVSNAVRGIALALLSSLSFAAVAQQDFPNKAIRFISPFPPGGHTDAIARLVGQKLTEKWGQAVVMDNRPGGSGVIAADALAKAAPDGYTMMIAINTLAINATLMPQLPYDTLKDLIPVATLASAEFLMVLNGSTPVNDFPGFLKLAKTQPDTLNFGTVGGAGIGRLAGELFAREAGIEVKQIPYKGAAQLNNDLLGGRLQYTIDPAYAYIGAIRAGKLKALAVTGKTRLEALPDVPTFAEVGLPGFDVRMWFGVFMPAGTPPAIINKFSKEIASILATKEVRDQLAAKEFKPFISTPEEFSATLKSDMAKYREVIKAANIKIE